MINLFWITQNRDCQSSLALVFIPPCATFPAAIPLPRIQAIPRWRDIMCSVKLPHATAHPWFQYLLPSRARPCSSASATWIRATGRRTCRPGRSSNILLLWVVGLSSLMAMVLQVIAARLGVVTGRDLAQCCRDFLPAWTRWPNYLSCEVAIAACDLAEVLGSAVAIHLLFPRISLLLAVFVTAFDVLILLLSLQRLGMRLIEAVILVLIATIAACYGIEIFVLPQTQPNFPEMARWLFAPYLPAFFRNKDLIYVAIGIVGATVMPHNLYLHSALVQSRQLQ